MYFKSTFRRNPETGKMESYYRLVESFRDQNDIVRNRTIVTAGFIDYLSAEELNYIQKKLTEKLNGKNSLFEDDLQEHLWEYIDELYFKILKSNKIDNSHSSKKDMHNVDLNSLKHTEARELGGEWMSLQTLKQLKIDQFLLDKKWSEEQIQLALTQIISRAVYPASENRTSKWIKENSAICELTAYPIKKITKDKLYQSALNLYQVKDEMEKYLSQKTNELFDIEDKFYLYDLTNTYFEGQKKNSDLAQYGRSKEKRTDAKLVVLAAVVNLEGFLKYSNIYQGNMADCKTLSDMIDSLREATSETTKKALIIMDAGIATDENLKLVTEKGYDYLCVSRTKPKKYTLKNEIPTIVYDKKNQKIELNEIEDKEQNQCVFKVKSDMKAMKERSMNRKFKTLYEDTLTKLANGLAKKSGIKKQEIINQKIGRLQQKYPSIAKHYQIDLLADQKTGKVISMKWEVKESQVNQEKEQGVYFIKTSLKERDEQTVWRIYNCIREIESTFRTLKTDLDLRPIYHQNDESTMAHLNLGLLAYWIVNTIRYQLKVKKINHDWQEIIRIANTQKLVTTEIKDVLENTIEIKKCSEPSQKLREIYLALNYKKQPFTKKKFVVPKSELLKQESRFQQWFTG
ncbi:IS1634 family transposase [Flavobacterium gawalongense]|uniref:IS1634 family transposase n=3 Tax=Flavobacterium TaxID=237 RepID=A0A553B8U4_9FLAO|nr:IS1634 family transposase [Flavobacterium gawalongense]TRX00120.1 IS1634 family transposase [Flavobacterium gawalongense]TRX04669.1 IS1634 family transposase [Flavobacterium gawalongense]TRX05195.1 IS1634 family transposase [Flavobacterium gawalongense]TRX21165.1 IS1634 family transposase [Flavobacterium gawalongense]